MSDLLRPLTASVRNIPIPARVMVKNSAAVLSSGAAVRAVAFATFVMLTRGLEPAEFGAYTLVLAIVEVVRQLVELGLGTATVRALKCTPRPEWADVLGGSFALRGAAAVLGYAIVLGMTLHPAMLPYRPLLLVAALTMFTGTISAGLTVPFQASLAMASLIRLQLALAAVSLLTISWGVRHDWDAQGFLTAYVALESLLAAGIALLFAARFRMRFRSTFRRVRSLAMEAAPIGVLGVVVLLYFRLDVFMLQAMAGPDAVGQYSLAFRISEAFLLASAAVSASTFPRYVELSNSGGTTALAPSIRSTYGVGVTIASLVALAVSVGAPAVMSWLSPQYASAGHLAAVLIWSTVFMFANMQTADALIAAGFARGVSAIAIGNLTLNIAANLILIPRIGAVGAVIATMMTEGVNSVVQGFYVRWRLGVKLPQGPWVIAACAAATALISALVGPVLAVAMVGAVLLAAGICGKAGRRRANAVLRPAGGVPGAD